MLTNLTVVERKIIEKRAEDISRTTLKSKLAHRHHAPSGQGKMGTNICQKRQNQYLTQQIIE